MFIDEDGLPRVVRWGEAFERGYTVNWKGVIAALPLTLAGRDSVQARLRALGVAMRDLPEIMHDAGVDGTITARRAAAIDSVRDGLGTL